MERKARKPVKLYQGLNKKSFHRIVEVGRDL